MHGLIDGIDGIVELAVYKTGLDWGSCRAAHKRFSLTGSHLPACLSGDSADSGHGLAEATPNSLENETLIINLTRRKKSKRGK